MSFECCFFFNVFTNKDFQTEDRNGTKLMEGYPPEDLGLPETGAGNTSITFVQEAITQLHQMMEWTASVS